MNIEDMLKNYLEKKARIRFKELDIEYLKENLLLNKSVNGETKEDIIEGICMSAKAMSDIPVRKSGGFYSITEEAAITCDEEFLKSNASDYKQIVSKINSIDYELEPIKREVQQVEIFLDGLTEKERFIAEKFYIQSWTWEEVVNYYNQEMPISKGLRSLKSIKQSLLKKIERISCDK